MGQPKRLKGRKMPNLAKRYIPNKTTLKGVPSSRGLKKGLAVRINKNWKENKSIGKNLFNMGLRMDPNDDGAYNCYKRGIPTEALPDKNASDIIQPAKKIATLRRQTFTEQQYMHDLVEKHGHNTLAMARDIRLNYFQHTPAQLEKKLEKYLETAILSPHQTYEKVDAKNVKVMEQNQKKEKVMKVKAAPTHIRFLPGSQWDKPLTKEEKEKYKNKEPVSKKKEAEPTPTKVGTTLGVPKSK
eukprot:TRINITY_DN1580_c0_g1_i1.p1 TRINITY_DN1580_c0_g1~~TRINITY_DN1580_c0_g1_i1.p1  ORF type:complete len:242 (+),score=46.04 TRINITY_DN1580_c0_g1_i1:193-918(+)